MGEGKAECSSTIWPDGAILQGVFRTQTLASGYRYGQGTQSKLRENGDERPLGRSLPFLTVSRLPHQDDHLPTAEQLACWEQT